MWEGGVGDRGQGGRGDVSMTASEINCHVLYHCYLYVIIIKVCFIIQILLVLRSVICFGVLLLNFLLQFSYIHLKFIST